MISNNSDSFPCIEIKSKFSELQALNVKAFNGN